MLLSLKNVSLNLGRTALLDKANLTLDAGERLCLMRRNGTGKSTLLKVIAGELKVDGGEIQQEQVPNSRNCGTVMYGPRYPRPWDFASGSGSSWLPAYI